MAQAYRLRARWEEAAKTLKLDMLKADPHMQKILQAIYYAGADTAIRTLMGSMSPGMEVEDEDLDVLQDMMAELEEFENSLGIGLGKGRKGKGDRNIQ